MEPKTYIIVIDEKYYPRILLETTDIAEAIDKFNKEKESKETVYLAKIIRKSEIKVVEYETI